MSLFQKTVTPLNKITGNPLALSTIRRRLIKALKASGYRIKRSGRKSLILAIKE